MLDYVSEDIDGMDDDADAEPSQFPPITGRWTATSTYDVYMVDTPDKKDDGIIRTTMRIKPLINHQSTNVSDAAHNRVGQRIVIPAPDIMRLRMMPKIPNTPSSPHPIKMKGKRVSIVQNMLSRRFGR